MSINSTQIFGQLLSYAYVRKTPRGSKKEQADAERGMCSWKPKLHQMQYVNLLLFWLHVFLTHAQLIWHKGRSCNASGIRGQSWGWQISWKQGNLRENKTQDPSINSSQAFSWLHIMKVENIPEARLWKQQLEAGKYWAEISAAALYKGDKAYSWN